MTSRIAKVCFAAAALAFAVNLVAMVVALVIWGPDALIATFRFGAWILFPFALPICAKYLR